MRRDSELLEYLYNPLELFNFKHFMIFRRLFRWYAQFSHLGTFGTGHNFLHGLWALYNNTCISRGDGEYGHLTLLAVLELITQGLSHISWGLAVNTNVGDGLCVGGVGGLCEGGGWRISN